MCINLKDASTVMGHDTASKMCVGRVNQTPHYWHNLNSYFTAFETLHIVFVHKLRQQINKLKVINTKLNIFYVDYTHPDNTSNLKKTCFTAYPVQHKTNMRMMHKIQWQITAFQQRMSFFLSFLLFIFSPFKQQIVRPFYNFHITPGHGI